ncbi:MAG: hypothetical protein AAEI92_11265 [Arenicellales bacterium]
MLPVEPDAPTPERLISSHAAYLDLTRSAAVAIYNENNCRSLEDSVYHYPTLDALGRLKQQRQESGELDVTAADLLESLGHAANTLLIKQHDDSMALAPVSDQPAALAGQSGARRQGR